LRGSAFEKKNAEIVAINLLCRDFVAFRAEESWLKLPKLFSVYA
jgi:hypothetical protein